MFSNTTKHLNIWIEYNYGVIAINICTFKTDIHLRDLSESSSIIGCDIIFLWKFIIRATITQNAICRHHVYFGPLIKHEPQFKKGYYVA